MFIIENKENEEVHTDMPPIDSAPIEELDEEIENVLGEDPALEKPKEIELHTGLTTRWNSWLEAGLKKEIKEALLKKAFQKGELPFGGPRAESRNCAVTK